MLAFVLVFNFFLFRIVDSDPLAKYRGRVLTAERRQEIIEKFGLDGSKWTQFVRYVRQTLRLDFGYSTDSGRRVWDIITEALPNTLWLVGTLDGDHGGARVMDRSEGRLATGQPIRQDQHRRLDGPVRHARVLARDAAARLLRGAHGLVPCRRCPGPDA